MHCAEPTFSDYVNPRLAEALLSRRDQFVVHWMSGLERLQARRTSAARCLEEERKGGRDLFSIVLKLLQGDRPGFVEGVYYWVDKVWKPDYSISDFYRELNVLEDTLEAMMPLPEFTRGEDDAARGLIHRLARPILEEVMNRTSDKARTPSACSILTDESSAPPLRRRNCLETRKLKAHCWPTTSRRMSGNRSVPRLRVARC
jgi:hypothetical protein